MIRAAGGCEYRGMNKTADRTSTALRLLGAALVLVVGGVHLQQYYELLRFVPTVGTMFLANAVGAVVVAGLLLTRYRVLGALAGIGLALGSIGALAASRYVGLFGYTEPTLRDPVALSLAAEVAAALVLGAYLVRQRRSRGTRTQVSAAPAAS